VIKCRKPPRKKCRFMAEVREKSRLPTGREKVRKGSQEMKGEVWMDIRSDRQKGLILFPNKELTLLPIIVVPRCAALAQLFRKNKGELYRKSLETMIYLIQVTKRQIGI